MPQNFIFSSESVGEGHPDKVCDTVSDAILDACLEQDPMSRVAIETMVKDNVLALGGEITTGAEFDYNKVVRDAVAGIGYTVEDCPGCVFQAERIHILHFIGRQSQDIAQGVDATAAEGKATEEQGAGDQGLMFGFAVTETPQLMPAPILYSHQLGQELTRLRKTKSIPWLRPDAKTQVSVQYEGTRIVRVDTVVISTMHDPDVKHSEIESTLIDQVVRKVIPAELIDDKTRFLINPTGRFVVGGPEGDAGLTGRKIIVDTYGGMGRHGGGAFSGKDPTKVDRSAAYMGRYVAKNIVAAGLATRCEVQFAYAIGYPDPVSVHVDTFGTNTVDEEKIEKAVLEVFSLKPADILTQLDLRRPIYGHSTNYGHFGREDNTDALTWERTDKVDDLKRAAA